MKKNVLTITIITTVVFMFAAWHSAYAANINGLSQEDYKKVARGGLLYDKWYSVLEVKTEGTHPAYPADGKKKGASTWRRKECHGWDYMGNKGTYVKGSHFTGIKGIRNYAGKNPKDVIAMLKDKTHAFSNTIPEESYEALSYFVAYGQIDMDAIIDRSNNKVSGDLINGARIYSGTCAKCHGDDGRTINFKTPEKPQYLGTLSNKNPWETLHKMRYGQPGTKMTSLLFMDIKDQADVLSYCQTLPVK